MRCSKCGSDNRQGRKFCADCGAALAATCTKCGAVNEPNEKFCGECGAALAEATVPKPPEVTPIAGSGDGERRHLTVLFCDLVGSTEIASRLDPEEWRETVSGYHRAAAEVINRYGGHVAKYLGDGIMAFFGYPEAHENDAERAVRAGITILDGISKFNQPASPSDMSTTQTRYPSAGSGLRLTDSAGAPPTMRSKLAIRIGIDSGWVVIGAGAGKDTDVFGEAPNISAHVQGSAPPGTVLITAATQRLVSGLFVVEDRGEQALKGSDRPTHVYRVLQPSGIRGRLNAVAATRGLTKFVGREDELRGLVDRWGRVLDGQGQVGLIIGEAGIGKSRLVQRFHEQIAGTPHIWIESGASAFFQNTPFFSVIEMLRQLIGDSPGQGPLAQLERRLAAAGLQLADVIPLLAPLLGLPASPKYPQLTLSPEQQRSRLLGILVKWLLASARAQPLVSVIEDLHWADPSTLELIELLVQQNATDPVLLLYTARPEFHAPWPTRDHHTQITLSRLNARSVREMIAQVAARKALADETVESVVERTSGVPLFVEELTLAVLEANNARLSGVEIPATLHDSLLARLDRLGQAKEVAQIGAVIGGEFSYRLLHAVHQVPEAKLQGELRVLVDAELVYPRGIPPEATYQFKHALVRDAAYEALLKTRRKELHRLVASAIEQKFYALKDAHPEVLARHWSEAGETEPAIAAWQKAGEQAVERCAYREAERHYGDALAALRSLPESPERDKTELALLLGIGPVLLALKGWASVQVEQTYVRAKGLGERSGEATALFSILMGLWVNSLVRTQFRAAFEIGEQVLAIAQKTNDSSLLLQAHQAIGDTAYEIGRFELARTHLETSLSLCGRERLKPLGVDMEVAGESYLARTLWLLGYPHQALKMNRQAVTLAQKLNDPFSLVFAEQFLSALHLLRREIVEARGEAERVIKICTENGFAYWLGHVTVYLGEAIAEQGQGEKGLALIKQGIVAAGATGAETDRVDFLRPLAEAYSALNRFDDALEVIGKTLEICREHEDLYLEAEIYRLKGELLLRRGDLGTREAEACFQRGMEIARAQSAKSLELRATTSLARLLARQGRRDEARTMLAKIYNWFTEGFDTSDLKDARALLDELATRWERGNSYALPKVPR
jgi:class 3 adenylate cyclase/predicted ATPase